MKSGRGKCRSDFATTNPICRPPRSSAHPCLNHTNPQRRGMSRRKRRENSRVLTVKGQSPLLLDGSLLLLLEDWYTPFAGYHLHCPGPRQTLPTFATC